MKELKIKLVFLIFKHVVRGLISKACSLKKMHMTLYLFCFHMSYFIFWNQERAIRKKSLNTFSLAAIILKRRCEYMVVRVQIGGGPGRPVCVSDAYILASFGYKCSVKASVEY